MSTLQNQLSITLKSNALEIRNALSWFASEMPEDAKTEGESIASLLDDCEAQLMSSESDFAQRNLLIPTLNLRAVAKAYCKRWDRYADRDKPKPVAQITV